jgi:hypothetical protein
MYGYRGLGATAASLFKLLGYSIAAFGWWTMPFYTTEGLLHSKSGASRLDGYILWAVVGVGITWNFFTSWNADRKAGR